VFFFNQGICESSISFLFNHEAIEFNLLQDNLFRKGFFEIEFKGKKSIETKSPETKFALVSGDFQDKINLSCLFFCDKHRLQY